MEHQSDRPPRPRSGPSRTRRCLALATGGAVVAAGLLAAPTQAGAVVVPDAGGFQLVKSDLEFILRQIRIAEAHAAGGDLLGPGPDQVNNPLLGEGLRTVGGVENNLLPGQDTYGAADTVFPRRLTPEFRTADPVPGPVQGPPTTYSQTSGLVYDAAPRQVSNLVVDQTTRNPAAVAAAERMGTAGDPIDLDGDPDTPPDGLFIPNTATDAGLSARSNAWFTFFGQFFDHGLDLVTKGRSGTVVVPLQPDDPLYVAGSPTNFMVLTRATNQPGPNGILGDADDVHEATNTTTSFVDQNQTYTSHPAHQVFLREYELNGDGDPVSTGKLLDGPGGGLATWADIKAQASTLLGVTLSDADVLDVPNVLVDVYGKFTPGTDGKVQLLGQGTGHAFLDDIAHHAVPGPVDDDRDPTTPPVQRTPDGDSVAGPDDGDPLTYDDELLDRHYVTGDGRGNENIGLTAVHHVFHSEHNRLVGYVENLVTEYETEDPAFYAQWRSAAGAGGWNGERLFQAARLVTEMQYQHLVFEEFGRKISPNIDVVPANESGYQPDLDPGVTAEFAHVVYRFGHSLLTETVPRVREDGTRDDLDLFEAFLNPVAFTNDGTLSPRAAAGSVVRGNIPEVANEIDEFVTDVLRNRLVGLPLDLATLNLTRARETGVPSLNSARRQFFDASGDSTVEPYTSWSDFGAALRNPESLVNFVAAYGLHPSVTGVTALEDKREAAALLVTGGDGAPEDRAAFLAGTGAWASTAASGLDGVDFWVGGLAEKPRVFGSMLGSTFNWVFEQQMENLQFGDRFYYLSRLIGTNLLGQLEANSFAALIERNTDAKNLPGDVFAPPDCTIDVSGVGPEDDLPSVAHCGDGASLVREANGTIRFLGPQHVHLIGSANADRLRTDEGDDTIVGAEGADRIEGGDGNDTHFGKSGNDVLVDINGDDVFKGDAGNDAINTGPGFDLTLAGSGKDFIVHGADPDEAFGHLHDDFIRGGDASDVIAGNDGDDWIEGGPGTDLLQGDNRNTFQNDPNGGDDVLIATSGNDDYDAEGGNDVMVAGSGSNRNEGMLGFDWVTNARNPIAANDDMTLVGGLPPNVAPLSDRFDLVEGLSGWNGNDVLRGDNRAADTGAELAFEGHELTADGIARISGLAGVLPAGATSFTGGNILLGGAGDDIIEPRGGDDVVDGDAWLNVTLSRDGTAYTSMTQLQAGVFNGTIDPGTITIARTVLPGTPGTDIDTVVFSGNRSEYVISPRLDRTGMTISHTGGTGADGVDRVRNVERLVFADQLVEVPNTPPNDPGTATFALSDTTPTEDQALTVSATATDLDGVASALSYTWQVLTAPDTWTTAATGQAFTPGDSEAGRPLRVVVTWTDGRGVLESATSDPTAPVANVNDAPTGALALSTTDVAETEQLTVDASGLADADGLGTLAYRWQQSAVGGAAPFGNIAGAAAGQAAFTPTNAQVNRRLRVVVSWTDGQGTAEQVVSGPTELVGDVFTGNGLANAWTGTAVRDRASGGGGNDTLTALDGPDTLSGDGGNDTVFGGGGDDTVRFTGTGGGFDAVDGGPGFDRITALAGGTSIGLRTLAGVEEISGGAFAGVAISGSGVADSWNLSAVALNGIGQIASGGGNDTVVGSATDDRILGGDGGDTLSGGSGNDTLFGQAGVDTLRGDGGDDLLDSGAGNDRLLFPAAFGHDTVLGFDPTPDLLGGQDRIVLTGLGITAATFGANVTIAGAPGGGTLVTVQGSSTITLSGVAPAAVTIADFTL